MRTARPAQASDPIRDGGHTNAHPLVVELGLPDAVVELLVAAVLERIGELATPAPEPWIGVDEAAEHLACKRKRIYDLVGQRRVEHRRDGSRLLFRRSALDAYLEETAP